METYDAIALPLGITLLIAGVTLAIIFRREVSAILHWAIAVVTSLGTGFVASFLAGYINIEGEFLGIAVRAGAGVAVFVITLASYIYIIKKAQQHTN